MTDSLPRTFFLLVALVVLVAFDARVGLAILTGPPPIVRVEPTIVSDEDARKLPVVAHPRGSTHWLITALGLNVNPGGSSGSSSDDYELGPFSLHHMTNAFSSGYTSISMPGGGAMQPPTCRYLDAAKAPSQPSSWDWTGADAIALRRDGASTLLVITCTDSDRVAKVVGSAPPPMTETMVFANDKARSAYRVTRGAFLGPYWWLHRLVGLLGVAAAIGAVGWLVRGRLRQGAAPDDSLDGEHQPPRTPSDLDELRAWASTPLRQALLIAGPIAFVVMVWTQIAGR